MPANLTPQYLSAEQRFKEATSPQEKISALEEMLSTVPKHKGTEKLQADLKRRLARLRSQSRKKQGASRGPDLHVVRKEGAGQVLLLGAPNSGKSSILARMTHANPDVGDYPYTTRLPQPGMMPFEDVQIQLVDMPPISADFYEGWMGNLARQADLVLLVLDLDGDALLEDIDDISAALEGSKVVLSGKNPAEPEDESWTACASLIVATKCDMDGASAKLAILREFYDDDFEILPVSTVTGEGLEEMRRVIFERLDVVRVYTKAPGEKIEAAGTPFVLKRGSTVIEAAQAVHKDFAESMKFARIWSSDKSRSSVKFDGQMVERAHVLDDGDVLELHM